MHLANGVTYQADVTLTGIQAMFGSASDVAKEFTKRGFTSVDVIDHGGGHFKAQGMWSGADRDVQLPEQVSNVAMVNVPPDAAQAALDMAAAQAAALDAKARRGGVPWPLLLVGLVLLSGRR